MAADMLFDVATLSLNFEQAMRNWPRAVTSCMWLNVATETVLDGIAGKRLANPEAVLNRLPVPFVAADSWYGDGDLPGTEKEAATIAEIYQCDAVVVDRRGDVPEPGADVVADHLRKATVAHLACHGLLGDDGSSLLLGGILPPAPSGLLIEFLPDPR